MKSYNEIQDQIKKLEQIITDLGKELNVPISHFMSEKN